MKDYGPVYTITAVKEQALGSGANTGWEATISLEHTDGDVTLFLENSGTSASLSVTFQIGFHAEGGKPSSFRSDGAVDTGTITWVTPPTTTGHTAGAVTDMTTLDITTPNVGSARVVLPRAPFVHFKITEASSSATANNVSLYLCHN